jgi:hypothetical protein
MYTFSKNSKMGSKESISRWKAFPCQNPAIVPPSSYRHAVRAGEVTAVPWHSPTRLLDGQPPATSYASDTANPGKLAPIQSWGTRWTAAPYRKTLLSEGLPLQRARSHEGSLALNLRPHAKRLKKENPAEAGFLGLKKTKG